MKTGKVLQDIATGDLDSFTGESFYGELCSRGIDTTSFFEYMMLPARNTEDRKLKERLMDIAIKLRFHERHMHLKKYQKALKKGLIVPADKSENLFAYLENFDPGRGYAETADTKWTIDDMEDKIMRGIREEILEEEPDDFFDVVIEPKVVPKKSKKRGRKPGRSSSNPAVTMIGSMPLGYSIEDAIKYSLEHDIPSIPELESMFQYIKNPGELQCLEEFSKHEFKRVKIQCLGPATMIQGNYDESDLWRPETHIVGLLQKINAKEIILFLDEPSLGEASPQYKEWWHNLFNNIELIMKEIGKGDVKLKKGVHICYQMDWTQLFKNEDINIISFNAARYGEAFTSFDGYGEFRNRKGKIAWGIEKPEDVRDFRREDLLTATCGFGGMNLETGKPYTKEECESYLNMLRETRVKLQNGTCKNN